MELQSLEHHFAIKHDANMMHARHDRAVMGTLITSLFIEESMTLGKVVLQTLTCTNHVYIYIYIHSVQNIYIYI